MQQLWVIKLELYYVTKIKSIERQTRLCVTLSYVTNGRSELVKHGLLQFTSVKVLS